MFLPSLYVLFSIVRLFKHVRVGLNLMDKFKLNSLPTNKHAAWLCTNERRAHTREHTHLKLSRGSCGKKQTHTYTRTYTNIHIHIHILWQTEAQNKRNKSLTKGLAATTLTFGWYVDLFKIKKKVNTNRKKFWGFSETKILYNLLKYYQTCRFLNVLMYWVNTEHSESLCNYLHLYVVGSY